MGHNYGPWKVEPGAGREIQYHGTTHIVYDQTITDERDPKGISIGKRIDCPDCNGDGWVAPGAPSDG